MVPDLAQDPECRKLEITKLQKLLAKGPLEIKVKAGLKPEGSQSGTEWQVREDMTAGNGNGNVNTINKYLATPNKR